MPLTAEYVLAEFTRCAETLREFGVKRIGVFGSVAHGEARADSDLDLLVELERHTFDDYFGAKHFLEDLFGSSVDLVELEGLRPRLRPYVEPDLRYAQGY